MRHYIHIVRVLLLLVGVTACAAKEDESTDRALTAGSAEAGYETQDMKGSEMSEQTDTLVLGGGCFWCIEAVFERIDGVNTVVAGYAGGSMAHPSYSDVTSGSSGHAEVARITFDPERVSLADLLQVFWNAHDPTTPNRQGADIGTQYRSIILYRNEDQRRIAEQSKRDAGKEFSDPIVTEVVPLKEFYEAEAYHQDYFNNNRAAPYCRIVIEPKLKKLSLE